MKWSHLMLLAICCLIGVALASPVKRSERGRRALVDPHLSDTILLPQPPIKIYWLGLPMGSACKNDSQCMSKLECGQPIGYGYDTTRCCGTFGATGCKIGVSGGESGCCVHSYHCEWRDASEEDDLVHADDLQEISDVEMFVWYCSYIHLIISNQARYSL